MSTDDVDARLARFRAREAQGREARAHGEDLRAAAGVVVAATQGVMGVVADMQQAFSPPVVAEVSSIVNAIVRGTTGVVGTGIDAALGVVAPLLGASVPGVEREAVLAAVNGVVGDRLSAAQSPLAIEMRLRPPLDERREGRLLVFVHGSCMNDLQWSAARMDGEARTVHDHGRALLRDLERDVTLAYVHYNSGRHVKHNGDELAALLEREAAGFDDVVLVGHSMGGLVARSAVAAAEREGHAWRKRLAVLVTLGTPHHGAPLERLGHLLEVVLGVTPWTAPLASLGSLRSAGVTDLRYGAVVDVDSDRFGVTPSARTHTPLPDGVASYAVAGTRSASGDDPAALASDDLVPVASALGEQRGDPARTLAFTERVIVRSTNHLGLLAHADVYAALRRFCA